MGDKEAAAIPYTEQGVWVMLTAIRFVGRPLRSGEIEFSDGRLENLVYGDEDGGAELDGIGRVIIRADGGAAAADVRIAIVEGDMEGNGGVISILAKMVGSGCSGSTGASGNVRLGGKQLLCGKQTYYCHMLHRSVLE